MGINWQMGVSDPMSGINSGLASLGQALQNRQQMERQAAQDQRQNTLADLQMKKYQRDETNRSGLQSLIQSQNQPRAVANPAYQSPELGPQPDPMQPATIQQPMDERAKAEEVQRYMNERLMFEELKQIGSSTTDLTDKIDERKRQGIARVQGAGAFAYSKAIEGGADKITASKTAAQAAMAQAQAMGMPTEGMESAQYDGNVSFTKAPDEIGGYMSTTFDPTTGKVDIKHIAAAKDPEALLDKRLAATAADTDKKIAAADRRAASGGGHGGGAMGKPPFGYRFLSNGDLEAIPGGPASPDGKQGGKILPASQLESIADMKRVKDVLAEAKGLLSTKNINTGPVAGRVQAAGAIVGLASDDFVNLQQKMQTAENIMLKLRSGAAVTESEYQRFKKEFPRTNDTPAVRDRKMNNAIGYASELMDSKMDIMEEGGYRVPKSVRGGNPQEKPAAPSAPKLGTVQDGYRFRGGDPANPKSWVKAGK